jgi:ubiquinone/menaquinone biosynthesis C-methylase UbiE
VRNVAREFDRVACEYEIIIPDRKQSYRFIDKQLPDQCQTLLDIGCGTGRLLFALRDRFDLSIGLDLSSEMLKVAKQHCEERFKQDILFVQTDVSKLPFPDNYFDCIVSHTTLHHLERNLTNALAEIHRITKPGGKVILIDIISQGVARYRPDLNWMLEEYIQFVINIFQLGIIRAWSHFRRVTNRDWINHLKVDRYLTKTEFIAKYSEVFPNSEISFFRKNFGLTMFGCMVWTKLQS